jgi:hypothetical protein
MFFILFFEKVGRAGGHFFYFLFSVANHKSSHLDARRTRSHNLTAARLCIITTRLDLNGKTLEWLDWHDWFPNHCHTNCVVKHCMS